VSQSSPQNQTTSPQNNVLGLRETGPAGIVVMPDPLLSSDSGMIVFCSSGRVLHMNGPARSLMALFGTSGELWPQMTPESMPLILTEFCHDVLAQLQHRIEVHDWAQFEMRRICHMVTPSLLLTGFGIQNSTNREIRIILTLNRLPSTPCAADHSRPSHISADLCASVSGAMS
jgi:hypothetical protein